MVYLQVNGFMAANVTVYGSLLGCRTISYLLILSQSQGWNGR